MMTQHNAPTVFVSSTCFDRSEVRSLLDDFIRGYSYKPMLSEYDSFPVAPDKTTIENCIHNVEQFADIMVLIVGKRAGWITGSGRTITNIEFLHARSKGIPVYAFIDRSIIDLIPVWKVNPTATFPGIDSPKLLEFADSLRSSDIWSYSFQNGTDIVETLKKQWASLFQSGLTLWRQVRRAPIHPSLKKLTGESFRLVLEKPKYWEYLLYCEVLKAGIAELSHEKLDAEMGIGLGVARQHFDVAGFSKWLSTAVDSLKHAVHIVNTLFNATSVEKAFGPPGVPGDPQMIVYLADRLIAQYRDSINWAKSVHGIIADELFTPLRQLLPRFATAVVHDIEAFSQRFSFAMEDLKNNPPRDGEHRELTLCLELAIPKELTEAYETELERITPTIISKLAIEAQSEP